jgi:hypothetical protein
VSGDEKTNFSHSYDLCPACVQKITEGFGLKSGEQLMRERDEQFRVAYAPAEIAPSPPLLPSGTCEACGAPYVGESCYFCSAET